MHTRIVSRLVVAAALVAMACTGPQGATGPQGSAGAGGAPAVVKVSSEPSGANCAAGGQKIEASVGDGPVTTAYVCNGPDGLTASLSMETEPAGANCAYGGKKLVTRIGAGEPVASYVCDGAPGASVVATPVPAGDGSPCPAGGVAVSDGASIQYVCGGLDGKSVNVTPLAVNDPSCPAGGARVELDGQAVFVCSGETPTVVVTALPQGHPECANGGQQIDVSVGAGPVTTRYVCHGTGASVTVEDAAGPDCPGGKLITMTSAAGTATTRVCGGVSAVATRVGPGEGGCVEGGIAVTSGGETQYVCDGEDVRVETIGAGANCAAGGVRIVASSGAPTYVCHGVTSTVTTHALEAGDEHCAAGGQRIDITTLGETTSAYVCNGVDGDDARVTVTRVAAGARCPDGGYKVETSVGAGGVTESYICDGTKVVVVAEPAGRHCAQGGVKISTAAGDEYVCNGLSSSVVVTAEGATAECSAGGQRIDVTDASGTTTARVCNGENGDSARVTVTEVPAGPDCASGGKKIETSVGAGTVATSYVCNGTDGTSAVATPVEPGPECANGGIMVTSAGAIQYVCNGKNGADGQSVTATAEPPGTNCANGGVALTSASGTDYVCNGSEGRLLSVNAGADQSAIVGSMVTLAGSVAASVIAYRWVQIGGPDVVLSDSQSLTATFTAPLFTTEFRRNIVLQLQASDGARVETDVVVVQLDYAPSCRALQQAAPSLSSGTYTIDPDGSGAIAPFTVTCDMTNDGGGWTVIALENTADAAGWSDGTITTASVGGASTAVHGVWGAGGGSSKTFGLRSIPHAQVRIKARYYAIDSWDNEVNGAQLLVDGSLRWAKRKAFTSGEAPGWVSATFTPAPWGNNANTTNGYWNVEDGLGLLAHTTNAVALQFATGIDQPASDESFAFSHVSVAIR